MHHSTRALLAMLALLLSLTACEKPQNTAQNTPDPEIRQLQSRLRILARKVEAAEAIRGVKRLQWAYGHYSELGLWYDFADLFADSAIGHYTQGDLNRDEIRELFFNEVGQGRLGLAAGRIYPHISFSPVVTLAQDGAHAKGRFRILAMLGSYGGNAIWFHGVYENAYVRERGVWKINEESNTAQVTGTFTAGLSSQPKGPADEPTAAFHYDPGQASSVFAPFREDPAAGGASTPDGSGGSLPRISSRLTSLQQRLDRLEDESAILNLQHQYGYALDRHNRDALAALFSSQGTLEIGQRGVYIGRTSVRHALDQFGASGPGTGQLDDHILFQTYVSISPDGLSARARVDQVGMAGKKGESAKWTQGIYENTFVKEDGRWRIQTLHYYPRLITDYAKGWGDDAQAAPGPAKTYPPDGPPTETYGVYPDFYIPAFHFLHPVTGRAPQYPAGDPASGKPAGFAAAQAPLPVTEPAADPASLRMRLANAEAGAARALAYDTVENLVNAYGFYLDECMPGQAAALFAGDGENEIPGIGYYRGAERIARSLQLAYCPAGRPAGEMALHHIAQPVITVAEDGRTAHVISRLWQVHGANEGDDYYLAGTLEGDAVYDAGQWKLSTLSTHYTWAAAVDEGWSRAVKNETLGYAAPEQMLTAYPPDKPGTAPRLAPEL